jgi:hypothetical protein
MHAQICVISTEKSFQAIILLLEMSLLLLDSYYSTKKLNFFDKIESNLIFRAKVFNKFSSIFVTDPCQAYLITVQNFRSFGSIGPEILVVSCVALITNHPVCVFVSIHSCIMGIFLKTGKLISFI